MAWPTNLTVTLTRITKDWQGANTEVDLGEFDVWNEDHTGSKFMRESTMASGTVNTQDFEKGMLFLFSDVDLNGCKVTISSKTHDINRWERFTDSYGDFHHIEAYYK